MATQIRPISPTSSPGPTYTPRLGLDKHLPPDILQHQILPLLDARSLIALSACSSPFRSLVRRSDYVWKVLHDGRWKTSRRARWRKFHCRGTENDPFQRGRSGDVASGGCVGVNKVRAVVNGMEIGIPTEGAHVHSGSDGSGSRVREASTRGGIDDNGNDDGDEKRPRSWMDEYIRRAALDARTLRRMMLVLDNRTDGTENPWPALLLDGEDAFDGVRKVAMMANEEASTVATEAAAAAAATICSSSDGNGGGGRLAVVVPVPRSPRRSDGAHLRGLARQVLVAINRFDVFRRWRDLVKIDGRGSSLFGNSLENMSSVLGGELDGGGGAERDRGSSSPTTNVEDGAILLARFYQTSDDLIERGTLDQFGEEIYSYIDELAGELRSRLFRRRRNAPSVAEQDAARAVGMGDLTSPFPLRTVLEQMKLFFSDTERDERLVGRRHEAEDREEQEGMDRERQWRGKFVGNTMNYYDYKNSLLDKVIATGRGIPISLSVLYAAIVRRATGMVLMGVGLPGHFVLGPPLCYPSSQSDGEPPIYVDPFHGGDILTLEDCRLIVQRYGISWNDSMVRPVHNADVWSRMVRNLANCHMIDLRLFDPTVLAGGDEQAAQEEGAIFATRVMNGILYLASDDILEKQDAQLARQHALHRQFC